MVESNKKKTATAVDMAETEYDITALRAVLDKLENRLTKLEKAIGLSFKKEEEEGNTSFEGLTYIGNGKVKTEDGVVTAAPSGFPIPEGK